MPAPMSNEDREYMQQQTGITDRQAEETPWRGLPHEHRVRILLGWITLFTGIVAAATVANFIAGLVLLNAGHSY